MNKKEAAEKLLGLRRALDEMTIKGYDNCCTLVAVSHELEKIAAALTEEDGEDG